VTGGGPHGFGAFTLKATADGAQKSGAAFVGNAGITLAGFVLGAALSLINEALAARFLGTEAYGSYGLALMLAKIGEIIALFGVPLSVLHFLPVHLSLSQSQLALGVIVGSALLPLAVSGGFAMGAGLWHDWIASHIFNQPQSAGFIAVLACAIPLTSLSELVVSIARSFDRFLPAIVLRNLMPPLCYMPVLIYLSVSAGPKIGAGYGYTAAAAVGAAAGLAWVLYLVRTRIGLLRPMLRLRPLYKYAAPIALYHMITIVLIWVDLFLLATLADAKSVGIYRGCTQVVLAFDLILGACSVATAPVYAVLAAEGRHQQLQETLTAVTRVATVLAAPLALVILVNGSDILGLLGPDFEAGRFALSILTLGQFVKAMFGSASIVLIIRGRQSLEAGNSALAACLNLMLNLFFIPRLGLVGAALSTALSLLVLSALRASQLWFVFGLRIADSKLARILLVSAPLAALVWAASLALGFGPGTGLLHLTLRLTAMGAVIGGGLWIFCLSENDRADLIGAILRQRPASARSQREP
jgi:O-antigen/teichoic acid export membrane protein